PGVPVAARRPRVSSPGVPVLARRLRVGWPGWVPGERAGVPLVARRPRAGWLACRSLGRWASVPGGGRPRAAGVGGRVVPAREWRPGVCLALRWPWLGGRCPPLAVAGRCPRLVPRTRQVQVRQQRALREWRPEACLALRHPWLGGRCP